MYGRAQQNGLLALLQPSQLGLVQLQADTGPPGEMVPMRMGAARGGQRLQGSELPPDSVPGMPIGEMGELVEFLGEKDLIDE